MKKCITLLTILSLFTTAFAAQDDDYLAHLLNQNVEETRSELETKREGLLQVLEDITDIKKQIIKAKEKLSSLTGHQIASITLTVSFAVILVYGLGTLLGKLPSKVDKGVIAGAFITMIGSGVALQFSEPEELTDFENDVEALEKQTQNFKEQIDEELEIIEEGDDLRKNLAS